MNKWFVILVLGLGLLVVGNEFTNKWLDRQKPCIEQAK